jgi:hypothetical protein
MFRSAALALLAGAAAVRGLVMPTHNATIARACGSHLDDVTVAAMEADFVQKKVQFKTSPTSNAAATATIGIYYHVIYSSTSVAGGYVPYVKSLDLPWRSP